MYKTFLSLLAISALIFHSCSSTKTTASKTNLSATEFAEKIKELPDATLLDVRTEDEYANGHIENALNYNINGNAFQTQIASLDKTKPVLVYCLSGGRSSAAASQLRNSGFEVYELNGGMMQWRAANLPETSENPKTSMGMNKQAFDALLVSDKKVLVDFYADWCAPCMKMKPFLEEIASDMSEQVKVVRINADENPDLCKLLNVDGLPVVHIYKDKTLVWSKMGFASKAELLEHLK